MDSVLYQQLKVSQIKRGKSVDILDDLVKLEEQWRIEKRVLDMLNKQANDITKQYQTANDDRRLELTLISNSLKSKIQLQDVLVKNLFDEKDKILYSIGNIVHDLTPVSTNEEDNFVIRTWGTKPTIEHKKHHHELLYMIGGYDADMGAEVAGHRGYYLTGMGMLLNNAIVQYGLNFLVSKQYIPVQTPYFMKQNIMQKVASLAEFDESLYKVTGNPEDEPMYLIATAEQPLTALNMNKSFTKTQLPIKYCGYSTNFRKEAGKHGKEAWGLFRVHQFEKIEQFVICEPDQSWEMMEEMIGVSEEFYQSLELPYRVVDIVSGDLNNAAARKYDLEAWFPTLERYRELVSCSNCTDYQSKRVNTKVGKEYVHMLNSTLTATERTLCCILENYQTEKGIRVPEVLKPYLQAFTNDIIPYIKGPPKIGKVVKVKNNLISSI